MVVCEFCNKELSSKSALKLHQTRTKSCLQKQGNVKIDSLKCKYCSKSFTILSSVKRHEDKCDGKESYLLIQELKNQIESLQEENKKLIIQYEEKLENREKICNQKLKEQETSYDQKLKERDLIIKFEREKIELLREDLKMANERVTTINNNNTNNYNNSTNNTNNIKAKYAQLNNLDLSTERIQKATENYTLDDYNKGPEGMADWCIKFILKDDSGKIHYICTDKNRRNFVYRDCNGTIVNDTQANRLKEVIKPLMNMKLKECKKTKYMELADIDDDNNEMIDSINRIYKENVEYGVLFEKSLVDKTYT